MEIILNETELLALSFVAVDPEDWVQNAASNRARIAIDEIVKKYVARALDESVQIPSSRDEIVSDAFLRGWVVSAAAREATMDSDPMGGGAETQLTSI